jgi:Tol biopolymer transport system component
MVKDGNMTLSYRIGATALLVLLTATLAAPPANAQYFGRNRVQYDRFDFQVLETEHFDIHYYPEEREAAAQAGVMAERWYARLSRLLNHRLRGRQVIIYYASHPHFQQTNAIGGAPGEATGGVTEVFKRRIVLPFAGPLKETDHVLGHELVHAFQFDMTGQGKTVSETTAPVALRLPLWFIEGMAEFLSVGPNDPHTTMWIRDAAANDRLPSIGQLYDPRYFPYRFGQAFWAYIAGRWGDDVVGRILNAAGRSGVAEAALQRVLRVPVDSLVAEWHESIRLAYDPIREDTKAPGDYGDLLLSTENSGGLNTAPALSPDGSEIVFLSERDLFSIDMYRADALTGQVYKRITKTALDPHFESLQFINSSGAWNTQGSQFAFGAISKGDPVLTVLDIESGNPIKEVAFPEIGEIFSPTWSPDGRYVAFSAIVGGLSDLYIYDLELDSLRRITNDMYAELQPAWSPDGRRIAFVTDRFSTNLASLQFGSYRLATLDPETGRIEAVPSFFDAKNINPQWSRDSESIYFLADRNGITNVYRLEMASSRLFQITDLYGGVSRITALSPALSSAAEVDKIAFGVYEAGDYNIYTADDPDVLRGTPLTTVVAQQSTALLVETDPDDPGPRRAVAGVLPPENRDEGEVESYLDNAGYGLVETNLFGTEPYKPGLSLDFISQPSLTAGNDQFGMFIGGGASAFWSDMLGRHNLATMFQIQGGVKDIAALVGYTNRRTRWNWGATVGQVPFTTGGFLFPVITEIDGEPVQLQQRFLNRQINRQITGVISYPFSRVQRVEFSGGLRNITFDRELKKIAISLRTGQKVLDETEDLATFSALNLAQGSAALVYDNSLFGATAPMMGQRYRLEATPTVGSLDYIGLLGDYRKYIMPFRPYTIAIRTMHFGRYGGGGDDPVLGDTFLGFPSLVRGYDFNSFTADECPAIDCPALDGLFGSRILVANIELRFPLFGALGIGPGMFGVLPIDVVAFGDAGKAWGASSTDRFSFFGPVSESTTTRGFGDFFDGWNTSVGAGLRFNVLGFLIAEIDYVHPYQRPLKGSFWQFHFTPGF